MNNPGDDSGYVISRLNDGVVVRPVEPLDNRRWYFDTRSEAHEWVEYLQRQTLSTPTHLLSAFQTTQAHTPGPWTIGRHNPESGATFVNIMSHQSRVASVIHGGSKIGEANARLIAAAPDLLAAAWLAMEKLDTTGEYPGIASELRAAIAKAKGRP